MLAILPTPTNKYELQQINSNAYINIGNFDHVVVEEKIAPNVDGEADISCRIYNPNIDQRKNVINEQIF